MPAVVDILEARIEASTSGRDLLLVLRHAEGNPREAAPGRFNGILSGSVLAALTVGAVLLIFLALIPAAFVGALALLPALAPLILIGLAIVFTGDLRCTRVEAVDAAGQPCTCHRDRLARVFQQSQ